MRAILDAIKNGDAAPLRAALERDPRLARKPQLILDAARWANGPALALLLRHGADPNASWRGYRPLPALIQERGEGEPARSRARLAAMRLLLDGGADPEQVGAHPPARALIVAAFAGEPELVKRLCDAGARVEGFAGCALA